MTYQNKSMNGFRALAVDELEAVSGGIIVVTGGQSTSGAGAPLGGSGHGTDHLLGGLGAFQNMDMALLGTLDVAALMALSAAVPDQPQATGTDIDGDGRDDGDGSSLIVVTATQAQVDAAQIAFDRATIDAAFGSYTATGLFGLLASRGGWVGAATAVAATGTIDSAFGPDTIEARADFLYQLDGADGVYDGFSNFDRQGQIYAP